MENRVSVRVWGRRAMFTDPVVKMGGEKGSYPIPTYESLKGIMDSIYWKPTFTWVVDRVRIMNPIRSEPVGARTVVYSGTNDLSIYSYLMDVDYEIQAHFEWNLQNKELEKDRNDNKHFCSAQRMIKKGGRFDVFLGTRECVAYVEPCEFGLREGAHDTSDFEFGMMFHGFDYPSQTGNDVLVARFWRPKMVKGVIEFIRPEECEVRKTVRNMKFIPRSASEEEDV